MFHASFRRWLTRIAFCCNEISLAIVAKARPWLINAVRRHPELINQPNTLGQTALHLSVYWLEGLQYLLDAGAEIDAIDQYGFTPIFYAATLSLHEPFNVLAGKECVLYRSNFRSWVATPRTSLLEWVIGLWRYTRDYNLEAILDIIIELVVERRHKLAKLARTSLDAQAVEGLRLSNETVLDRNASTAISMLSEKTDVPAWLKSLTLENSTVYNIGNLNLRNVQRLWDAGFREIDEADKWGLSPLMTNDTILANRNSNYWEVVTWLVAKGADLHRRQQRVFRKRCEDRDEGRYLSNKASSTTALHYLAANSGRELGIHYSGTAMESFRRFVPGLEAVSEQGRRLVLHVLSEPLPDSCNCACSALGCRAYTMMAKCLVTVLRNSLRRSIAHVQEELLEVSQALAQVLSIEQPSLAWLRVEMIRFNTFEMLDLRHTCCEMNTYRGLRSNVICERYDDEEIHEIQEEQAEQVEKLETLLVEFENKYEESGSTFKGFMDGYWRDRMKEVLAEEGTVDHEALKGMGIVLRKEDNSSSGASDDEQSYSQASDDAVEES